MFQTLAEHGINVRMIATSPIKVSCVIAREKVPDAVKALHAAFADELELARGGAAHV
jgi:aspartate kinase